MKPDLAREDSCLTESRAKFRGSICSLQHRWTCHPLSQESQLLHIAIAEYRDYSSIQYRKSLEEKYIAKGAEDEKMTKAGQNSDSYSLHAKTVDLSC